MTNRKLKTPAEIADTIRRLLKEHKILWKEVVRVQYIAKNTLNTIARGAYPRIDTMYKIAEMLDVTIDTLVYFDETE